MFRFARELVRETVGDAARRMGTTPFALVAISILPWVVSRAWTLLTVGVHAALASWGDLTAWWAVGVWILVLVGYSRRNFGRVLREHRRVFRLIALGQDQHSAPDRISIWCALDFCRDFGPAELVVRVVPLSGDFNARVVHMETLPRVARSEQKRLVLASLRIGRPNRPAYHSVWGSEPGTENLLPGQVPLIPGPTRTLLEILIGPQTYRCYIEFVQEPPGALSPALYMTDEVHSPWVLKL